MFITCEHAHHLLYSIAAICFGTLVYRNNFGHSERKISLSRHTHTSNEFLCSVTIWFPGTHIQSINRVRMLLLTVCPVVQQQVLKSVHVSLFDNTRPWSGMLVPLELMSA